MKRIALYILTLFVCCGLPQRGYAQVPDTTQIGADRVEERLPEDLLNPSIPSATTIPLIEGIPEQGPLVPDTSGVTFRVDNIIVQGNTVFDNDVIHYQIRSGIGDNISLTDLRQVAMNLTTLYRQEGYAFSSAYVPQQTLENNTVTIQVIEGYVGEVEYRGIDVPDGSIIQGYAKSLTEMRPVKTRDLERYVLLINDLQGIQAKAIMSLIKDRPGVVKLILLLDETRNQAGLSLNNRGSSALGPLQSSLFYKYNNLLGANDQTTFIYLTTPGNNELRFFSLGQDIPIGGDGARLFYSLRRSESKPGGQARSFDISSQSNSMVVGVTYPWIRTRRQNLTTEFNFDLRNSATESFDAEIIGDHLRYLRGGLDYSLVHNDGITDLNLKLSKGLDILDATKSDSLTISRIGAYSDASKLQGDIKRLQPLTDSTNLILKATGQWAFKPVLSAELFGIGGSEYGRAFDFSTVTGDNGYAASAEVNYKIPYQSDAIDRINVYGFIDGGQAYDKTNLAGDSWQGLSTFGGGADVSVYKFFNARFEVAKPLSVDVQNTDYDYNPEVYGSLFVKVDF